MAFEVTATRKRPQDFDTLLGQEFVVSTLENALKDGRVAHAYLFSGPRGVGKTSSARLLAKGLNCEKGISAHPCGECENCKMIKEGTSPDVIEIDGASNTSVNDIREIKEEVLYPPHYSRYKIYIIDEVHMLSTSAFNALLKTIEEPPEYVVFIFATTELQKVPATIRSRCQQFKFNLIPQNIIEKSLENAAKDEGKKIDKDALFYIAKESGGSMRDAYTLFDQVSSFSGKHITMQGISEKLNIVDISSLSTIIKSFLLGDVSSGMDGLSSSFNKGVSPETLVRESASLFRTLLLYKNGIRKEELLGEEEDKIPKDIVSLLSKEQLEVAFRAFLNIYRDLKYSISPRYEVELLFTRLSSLPNLVSQEELVKRLENIKDGIKEDKIVIKRTEREVPIVIEDIEKKTKSEENNISLTTKKETQPSAIEAPAPKIEKAKLNMEEKVVPVNTLLLDEIKKRIQSGGVKGNLIQRHLDNVVSLREEDGKVVFTIKGDFSYEGLKNYTKDLKDALFSITKRDLQLNFEKAEEEKEEEDERLLLLKEIFGGNIEKCEKVIIKPQIEIKENISYGEPVRTFETDGDDAGNDEDD